MQKKAYITLLSTDNYLKGVMILHRSLKRTNPKYPLIVMLSPNISDNTINRLALHEIETIRIPEIIVSNADQHNQSAAYSHWSNTFDKLYIFNLVQFHKIVYIDCDMLVMHNIDELFDKEHMSAVSAGSKYPGNEDWEGNLNSGLLVIVPNKDVYSKMIALIPAVAEKYKNFGDQDIIKEYCQREAIWTEKLQLDQQYNIFSIYTDWYVKHEAYRLKHLPFDPLHIRKDIKIIHYIGYPKPWMRNITWLAYLKMRLKTLFWAISGKEIYRRYALDLYYRNIIHFNKL